MASNTKRKTRCDYELVRYEVDADREPIYSSRQLVAKFASGGTANFAAQMFQRDIPGTVRGMYRVELGTRCLYSVR